MSELLAYGGLLLQLLALILLIRGPLTRYFPVFLYLVTVIVYVAAMLWVEETQGTRSELYFNVYWGGEILIDLLLFFTVISLTIRALDGNPLRGRIVQLLTVILVVALVAPFVLFDSSVFGRRWNQSVAQLFNFGAALMNLALWSALILARTRDRQLFTVSAGLGVTVAAAALTLGVRQFTKQDDVLRIVTDYVYRLGQLAGPLIWCYAFRPPKRSRDTPHALPSTTAV